MNSNHKRDLWTELKKINKVNRKTANSVDGYVSDKDIAEVFANKYRQTFTSAKSDDLELEKTLELINNRLHSETLPDHSVCVGDVIKAIQRLKFNKGDGMKGTVSDLFIHATHRFYVIFNALLNSMLIHGHSPDEFISSVLVSIPKDTRGNLLTSDNYRGIALCSALSKVVDYFILGKYSDDLQSSNLQFAYKKDHSTTMCTAVLKEVVSHYNSNGSNVFACSLDATKAFDRVNYVKLFNLLLERNLPGVIIRLLFDSYSRQFVHTRWNSALSDPIPMENGVKQGGVLSPILFCIYFDELLKRIERTGIGCHIGHHFYGGLGYADDVVLLSPTVRGLQLLINTCEKFATEHNVDMLQMLVANRHTEQPLLGRSSWASTSLIARVMGPILVPWTLLSGMVLCGDFQGCCQMQERIYTWNHHLNKHRGINRQRQYTQKLLIRVFLCYSLAMLLLVCIFCIIKYNFFSIMCTNTAP